MHEFFVRWGGRCGYSCDDDEGNRQQFPPWVILITEVSPFTLLGEQPAPPTLFLRNRFPNEVGIHKILEVGEEISKMQPPSAAVCLPFAEKKCWLCSTSTQRSPWLSNALPNLRPPEPAFLHVLVAQAGSLLAAVLGQEWGGGMEVLNAGAVGCVASSPRLSSFSVTSHCYIRQTKDVVAEEGHSWYVLKMTRKRAQEKTRSRLKEKDEAAFSLYPTAGLMLRCVSMEAVAVTAWLMLECHIGWEPAQQEK